MSATRSPLLQWLMIVAAVVLVPVTVFAALKLVGDWALSANILATHSYAARGEHLTEAQVLEILPDMLTRAGLQPDDWQPYEDDRAEGPDGTPEIYLVRVPQTQIDDGSIHLTGRPEADGPGPKTPLSLQLQQRDGMIEAVLWLNK